MFEVQTVLESIKGNGIKILVHGLSGAGKTVLCATTGAPTIILSAENGLLSLRKHAKENPEAFKKIKVVTIETFEDLKDARKTFKRNPELCEWIALDSISEIAEQILYYEKKNNKDPRRAYGIMQDDILDELRKFRDMAGYNVIMTCKQKMLEDHDTGRTIYMPMLPGKNLPQEIPYMFDEVFALRVEHDEDEGDERWLQTGLDSKYFAKDRSGELDMFEQPNLKLIAEKIEGGEIKKKEGKKKKSKSEKK